MITFEQLKTKQLNARRFKDTQAIPVLTTLVGDLQANAKLVDGEKVVTDQEVDAMIRKFLKGAKETLSHGPNEQAKFEKFLLEDMLPQQMTEDELSEAIADIIEAGAGNMGAVMGQLKAKHAGLYDGKMASQIAKAAFA